MNFRQDHLTPLLHSGPYWSVPRPVSQLDSEVGSQDFPRGPVAKTLRSQCGSPGLIPGQGIRPHLSRLSFHPTATDPACFCLLSASRRVRLCDPVDCSTRPPCPSPSPGAHSNSCLFSRWCHPTISSSVVPFSCRQSFPASGFFQMSQFFASGGQSTGASASASVLPVNIQDWFPLAWTDWISLQSKGLSRVFSICS